MYRSLRPTVLSFKKIFQQNLRRVGEKKIALLPVNYRNIWSKIRRGNGEEAYAFIVLCQAHAFISETRDRDDIKSFCYESILEDKEAFTRNLLRAVGIGEEFLSDALSALERDSQAKSHLVNRERLSRVKNVSISTDIMEWARIMARDEFGIELKGDEGRIAYLN
jgi:hypothetical protein